MKKFNYLYVAILACIVGLASCSQQEDVAGEALKTAEIEIGISKADMMKSGSLIGEENTPQKYCKDEMPVGGVVTLKYEVSFDGFTSQNSDSKEITFEYTNETNDIDGLSKLIQIDFPVGSPETAIASIKVTEAIIYDVTVEDNETPEEAIQDENAFLNFAAPKVGSAFADYVTYPLGTVYEVGLYKKEYIKVEVLCFEKQNVALFGYTWFDFEIVTGDEVCVFFNCLGTTSDTYHQVFAASFDAYIIDDNGNDGEVYWSGANYTELGVPAKIEPICIPCPGNYGTNGFRIKVTPMGYTYPSTTIDVSADDIAAFLDKKDSYTKTGADYTLEMAYANEIPFLHFTMNNCYKPDAYLSNVMTVGGELYSEIYGVTLNEELEPTLTKMFQIDDYSAHIAMTPDETTLLAGNARDAKELTSFNIYTLVETPLSPDATVFENRTTKDGSTIERWEMYHFVQLIYIEDQLYAGCMKNNCLVPITIDWINNTFGFGPDLIDADVDPYWDLEIEDIRGGDLLAGHTRGLEGNISATYHSLLSFSQWNDDTSGGSIMRFQQSWNKESQDKYTSEYILIPGLENVNGACLAKDGTVNIGITSHKTGGKVVLKVWEAGNATVYPTSISSVNGGDMASGHNPDVWIDNVAAIFHTFTAEQIWTEWQP